MLHDSTAAYRRKPGDPVYYLAGQSGDEAYYALIRAKFGLDQPLGRSFGFIFRAFYAGTLAIL
ncbi:MAG: hypothetical protein ABIP78_09710 [Pyrinomonadaceae bacterium]